MGKASGKYVGTAEAVRFIRKHHGDFRLPPDELFAFAQDHGTDKETYIIVSEQDPALEVVGCRYAEDLGVGDRRYDALERAALLEARACFISPPFSVTIANRLGVLSYPQRERRKRASA